MYELIDISLFIIFNSISLYIFNIICHIMLCSLIKAVTIDLCK